MRPAPLPGDPVRSGEPIVSLEDIRLDLASAAGIVNVLRGVSFTVAAGETVGLVGPSGSGKSTMLMVMGGLERPTAGTVRLAGRDLAALDEDGLARLRRDTVGIVFQSFHLIPTMTALENVAMPLELAGRRDAFAAAESLLRSVELGHRLLHYPAQLSGGEQQRVALARAFAPSPRLLLADEPTGNLDGTTGRHVVELLFELRQRHGTSLVLVTHDPKLAERCDRIVEIADGCVVAASAKSAARVV